MLIGAHVSPAGGLYKAVERGTNDPDMMDHLRDVQAVLDTQDLSAPRSVDEGLAELEEWPSDLGALGIIVETVIYMARMAADKARLPLSEVSAYLASCLD